MGGRRAAVVLGGSVLIVMSLLSCKSSADRVDGPSLPVGGDSPAAIVGPGPTGAAAGGSNHGDGGDGAGNGDNPEVPGAQQAGASIAGVAGGPAQVEGIPGVSDQPLAGPTDRITDDVPEPEASPVDPQPGNQVTGAVAEPVPADPSDG